MILRPRNWEPIAVQQIEDVSFGKPSTACTLVLYRRHRDGKHATKRIRGYWKLRHLDPSGETDNR